MLIFMLLLFCLSLPPASEAAIETHSTWSNFRSGHQNQGRLAMDLRPLLKPSSLQPSAPVSCSFDTRGLIWSTPITDSTGHIYFGSTNKYFYKLSPTCQELWRYELNDEADAIVDSAAYLDESAGVVYIPGGDGYIHAVDTASGQRRWSFKAYHSSDTSGVVVNSFEGNVTKGPHNLIYAGSDNGYMYALNEQGQEVWSLNAGEFLWSMPAFSPHGRWMVFGSLNKKLHLVDQQSGTLLDVADLSGEIKASPMIDDRDAIYVGSSNGRFYSYEVISLLGHPKLKKRWEFKTSGEIYSSAALMGDLVLFASQDGNLYALERRTGKLHWKYATNDRVASSPLVSQDQVVVFGGSNGKLYVLDGKRGERLFSFTPSAQSFKNNLDASAIVSPQGQFVVGSYDGKIYLRPLEFCAIHPEQCQFGGTTDLPPAAWAVQQQMTAMGEADRVTFVAIDRDGQAYPAAAAQTLFVKAHAPLTFRLVVFENGRYIPNALIASKLTNVYLNGRRLEAGKDYFISSDNKLLNVVPRPFWQAATDYKLEVIGKYFHAVGPIANLFQWSNLPDLKWQHHFSVSTPTTIDAPIDLPAHLRIKSLYAFQPRALDTLIPAALDGQNFLMTKVAQTPDGSRALYLTHSVVAKESAVVILPEPEKTFTLVAERAGNAVNFSGDFTIAAMGGTVEFSYFHGLAQMAPSGIMANGHFVAQASCLSIRSNGRFYLPSANMIDDLCDDSFNLVTLGRFETAPIPMEQLAPLKSGYQLAKLQVNARTLQLKLSRTVSGAALSPVALVSVVRFDPKTLTVTQLFEKKLKSADSLDVSWAMSRDQRDAKNLKTAIFVDQEIIAIQ